MDRFAISNTLPDLTTKVEGRRVPVDMIRHQDEDGRTQAVTVSYPLWRDLLKNAGDGWANAKALREAGRFRPREE